MVIMKGEAMCGKLLVRALVVTMKTCNNVRKPSIFDSIYSVTRLLVRTLVVAIGMVYGKDSDNMLRRLCQYRLRFTFIRRAQLINVSYRTAYVICMYVPYWTLLTH